MSTIGQKNRHSTLLRKLLAGAVVATIAGSLSSCDMGVLDPKGPIGVQEKQILIDSLAIMLAIVIPTILTIGFFAWWYREGNPRARRRPDFVYSGRVELVVWSIPALTVLLLSGVIWVGSHRLDPSQPLEGAMAPIDVEVVSLDWKWLFIYPSQKIVSVNRLVVPVGAPIRLRLTSGSVMNAFFVPQLGSMIYTMSGMASRLNLRADEAGDYQGISAHISGDGFSDMRFVARAVTPEQFADWAKQAASSGQPFDDDAYKNLSRQGLAQESAAPLGDPALFESIVNQRLPPGPGPAPTPHPTAKAS